MNTSTNASVETTLSPSLAFSTFPDPRTSLPDPIPSTNLPSTLPTNASITSFRKSSSRAMSPSTTAKASPVLCHRSPTLIIQNACDFCRISLAGLSTLWMIKHDAHRRRRITRWSKHLENVGEIIPPSRSAQWTARAFQHSRSTTSTDQLLIQPRVSLTETLTHSTLTLSLYFEATPPVTRQQPVGRVLVPSIRSFADCFREKQLQRRCIHVMRTPLLRHSSPSSLCVIPRLDGRIQSGGLQLWVTWKKRSVTTMTRARRP
jgi:hypothetical protein